MEFGGKIVKWIGNIAYCSLLLLSLACNRDDDPVIPNFNFDSSVVFEPSLSAYGIFSGLPSALTPSEGFHLLELSSPLFTDYAHKQRLIKIPEGMQATQLDDGSIHYPNGTIMVKTFYYYHDEREPSRGKRLMESRLLIKENGVWNLATYLWNTGQTDATLELSGFDTQVSWTNAEGNTLSTLYHVPSLNECGTCHQSQSRIVPLGPSLRNLNREVQRQGISLNQVEYLQKLEILEGFPTDQLPKMVDYKDSEALLQDRGRAYLAMNCAHCHNPDAWEAASQRGFDFRFETPLSQTGILAKKDKIARTLANGRMPFLGTTMLDEEGLRLVTDYLNSL